MRRRDFLSLLGGVAVLPPAALAQSPRAARKLGYLHPRTIAPDHPTLSILRREWQRLGYVEGETVLLRSAGDDPSKFSALVAEFNDLDVGALIAVGPATVKAASQASVTMPIVAIDLETDPISSGLVASYARPGGNVTGLFLDQPSMASKLIELLREAAPSIERVVIVWDPSAGPHQLAAAKEAARTKGIDALVLEARPATGYDDAFSRIGGRQKTGIVQFGSAGFIVDASEFSMAAKRHQLPSISNLKVYAKAGVLMTYGPSQEDYFSRAVTIADKILKGEKASDIPIERPTKFELTINLSTAKALNLKVPLTLQVAADEIFE